MEIQIGDKGRMTLPLKLRMLLGIKEGDELVAEATDQGILFKPVPRLEDCAGIYSKYGKVEEIKKEIDKLREEY
jgi:AbrB family looped-hinge helix DNA binding protein